MTRRTRDRVSQGCCLVGLFGCLLVVLSDLTGNHGLWTLGGAVGPARWTVLLFVLLFIGLGVQVWRNGGDGPFQEVP